MKNRKPTTLVVTIALVLALCLSFGVTGCNQPKPTQYTVTFVGGEGASGTAPAAQSKQEGEKITLPENTFAKEEHTFTGWSDGATTYQAGSEYTVGSKDVTFTAQWTANEYTVTFAKGTDVTGDVPAAVKKKKGEKITLDDGSALSKEGDVFVGWSDGKNTYDGGAEYTVNGTVTLTAVFQTPVEYVNYFDSSAMIKGAKVVKDELIFDYYASWQDVTYSTVYTMAEKTGNTVEFTLKSIDCQGSEDYVGKKYTGINVNGVIIASLPVTTGYAPQFQNMILSEGELSPASGLNGPRVTNSDFEIQESVCFYSNKMAVHQYASTWNAQSVFKVGTFTIKNGLYTVTYEGESIPVSYKLNIQSYMQTFDKADSLIGEYTYSGSKVNFDGFGNWEKGTYIPFVNDTAKMVFLNDTENLTSGIFEISGTDIVTMTAANAGEYKLPSGTDVIDRIYYNGGNLVGITTKTVGNASVTIDGETAIIVGDFDADIKFDATNQQFTVKVMDYEAQETTTYYYTLNGKAAVITGDPPPVTTIETGSYVNNLDSSVTAQITASGDGYKLTLTKDSTTAEFSVTRKNDKLSIVPSASAPFTGYIVNDVIFGTSFKIGGKSVMVVLSKNALTLTSDITGGYAVPSSSSSSKLYLYTNNVAFYQTSTTSGKIGSFENEGNVYSIKYTGSTPTSAIYKVVAGENGANSKCLDPVGTAGTYTLGSDTIVLDGFGTYTKGGASGKYVAGASGFGIYEDGQITGVYSIGENNALTVVTETTDVTKDVAGKEVYKTGNSAKDALAALKISFKTECYTIYEGCGVAKITYSVDGGEEISVNVGLGDTITIGTTVFTVTACKDSKVQLSFKDGTYTRSVVWQTELGVG